MRWLVAPARRARRRQAVNDGRGAPGDTLADMITVALGIPPAQPGWFNECRYYQCRSGRGGLLLSVVAGLDPADRRAVRRAAEALWDALEHCAPTYDRAIDQ